MAESVTDKIDEFFSKYQIRTYAKGKVLILNGSGADHVYKLISGTVKQYDVTYKGDEVILNVFKPGAFFPMSLAINKGANPYIYEAESDIEVRQAPADEVVNFIKQNPDVIFDLLSRVYRGLDGLLGRMAHLMTSSAKARLMYELIIECRRFGEQSTDGVYELKINEVQLGSRAGLTRETVSREMHKLKENQLVSVSKNVIRVLDLEGLEKKLGLEV
jgi:CRP-like cAMP-binding protein